MTALRWFEADEDLSDALVVSGELHASLQRLARELRHADRFLRFGVDPPTRVLFSGPSGTGKTLAARWVAWTLRSPLAIVDVAAVVGSHLGESASALTKCFEAVRPKEKAIIFLDEIDAICMKRGEANSDAGKELARSTTTFFQQVDWLPPQRIVMAATNFAEDLDPALRRRFWMEVRFTLPNLEARRRMLDQWLPKAPLLPEQLNSIAERSEGMSGAELRSFAMEKARDAIMALPDESVDRSRGKLPEAVTRRNVECAQGILLLLDQSSSASPAK